MKIYPSMKSSNTPLTISINILYTFYTIICVSVTRGYQHEIESSTCHRRSTVTTEGKVHRGISNQNGLHCEVRKSAQTASSEQIKMEITEGQNAKKILYMVRNIFNVTSSVASRLWIKIHNFIIKTNNCGIIYSTLCVWVMPWFCCLWAFVYH